MLRCSGSVPTISITNSIAFANMKNPDKEFGLVRMGGTIGWILAAWPFTFILVDWAKVDALNPQGAVAWIGAVLARRFAAAGWLGWFLVGAGVGACFDGCSTLVAVGLVGALLLVVGLITLVNWVVAK